MKGIIDMHAHVLPGVDDGARTMDESYQLLCMAAKQGIRGVILTPHGSGHRDTSGWEERRAELEERTRTEYPNFQLYLGQELYYHEELPKYLKSGSALTMAGSRYVLVEFDTGVDYKKLYRGIRALGMAGYYPVLAHMERYQCLRKEENLEELLSSRCLLQMNYESLQGSSLRAEVRWCRKQVLNERIHMLGTDMHRTDYRPPRIQEALAWLEGHIEPEQIAVMTRENPLHMINKEGIDQSL